MDMFREEDYFLCFPSSSYSSLSTTRSSNTSYSVPVTTTTTAPTCSSSKYLSFNVQEHVHHDGFAFHCGTSPTTKCSSSISSSVPQAKKKGRGGDQKRKAATAATTAKKPRVKKERIGERIMALHQLVSPYGKSDTASVLHEALGYIRFLHEQVQVLSSPYTPLQRLPPSGLHMPRESSSAGLEMDPQPRDLRSRGLCLVSVSCTERIAGDDNGADLWYVSGAAAVAEEEKNSAPLCPDHPFKH